MSVEKPKRKTKDVLDAFIAYQEKTEPPEIYKRWVGVSLIASVLQRKCWLTWGPYEFYPNMYIILVGPPGKARKGTAMRPAKQHLKNLQIKTAAEATTREALIRRIAESVNTFDMSDPETKTIQLRAHCSLTVFSDELTVFIGYNNKELMANLADWFDCAESWTYDTKGKGTDQIQNIWLNLLGATTPELIQATMPLDMIGGGLSSRMLFIYAKKKGKKEPCPMMTRELIQLRNDVDHDLEMIYSMNGRFTVTEGFLEDWIQWYMGKPEECPLNSRHLDYYWERREVHLLKLSMIMSASRSQEMIIRRCDMARAHEWLLDAERFMPHAFMGMGHRDDAAVVAMIMNEIAERGVTNIATLTDLHSFDVTQDQLVEIVRLLQMKGFCRYVVGMDKNWKIIHKDHPTYERKS